FQASNSASLVITSATALDAPIAWTGAGLVADVQAWLDNTEPNYGWIMRIPNDQTTPNSTLLEFHSREAAQGLQPVLTVDYTVAETAAVPEPATWTLAAMGLLIVGMAAGRYRRVMACGGC